MLPVELSLLSRSSLRLLSTSSRRSSSRESPTYAGLFYHALPSPSPPNSFSLSFLPTPPPSLAFSPTTIGVLSQDPLTAPRTTASASPSTVRIGGSAAEAPQGTDGPPALTPRNFVENREFAELLHEVLAEAVGDDLWIGTAAKVRGDGYIHIADERNPADANRVPDPSDIIASVLVQHGEVVQSSYSPSGTHRIVTMDGMMRLPESLMAKFRKACEVVRSVEEDVARGTSVEE